MTPTVAPRLGPILARCRRLLRLPAAGRAAWLAVGAASAALLLLPLGLGYLADAPRSGPSVLPGLGGPSRSAAPAGGRAARESGVDRATWRPAAIPAPEPAAPWGRRIIRQATLEVELPDVDRAIARLTELVEAAGGYVADTHVHSDGTGTARATVTAYVPPGAFGRALADLERLGHATARRITGQDVSEEFVDLEARARNLERHEAQLLGFMGRAQKVADLLSLENELARVRGEIERLTGRIRFLRARTEMAAIQVSLVRSAAPLPADSRWARGWERVRQAFVAGWKAAFDLAVAAAALTAQLSPLALPAVLGWALYRRAGGVRL